MSSILIDLRAALEAKQEAWAAFTAYTYGADQQALLDEYDIACSRYKALLTDDTIRALLDVAEAATEVRLSDICALMENWYCEAHSCDACGSVTYPCVLAPLRAMERTLAPLVEEERR